VTGKAWRNRDSSRLNGRKGGVIWGELVGIGSRLASSRSWLTSRIGEWARVGAECGVDRCCRLRLRVGCVGV